MDCTINNFLASNKYTLVQGLRLFGLTNYQNKKSNNKKFPQKSKKKYQHFHFYDFTNLTTMKLFHDI